MKDILGLLALSWPLVLLILIVLVILVAVPLVIWHAKKRGHNKWAWGIGVFLLIFLPIFWDWIPTLVAHKYYCSTEAGFWVYKTVDQWKAENPGVMETLVQADSHFISEKNISSYTLNNRFKWVMKDSSVFFLPLFQREELIVDMKNDNVLARYLDYSSGYSNAFVTGNAGLTGMKFWLVDQHCDSGAKNQDALRAFRNSVSGEKK